IHSLKTHRDSNIFCPVSHGLFLLQTLAPKPVQDGYTGYNSPRKLALRERYAREWSLNLNPQVRSQTGIVPCSRLFWDHTTGFHNRETCWRSCRALWRVESKYH